MEQNMPELLADYTDESVIISNMGTFHGLDEIKSLTEQMFAELSQPDVSFTPTNRSSKGTSPTSSGTRRHPTTSTSSVLTPTSSATVSLRRRRSQRRSPRRTDRERPRQRRPHMNRGDVSPVSSTRFATDTGQIADRNGTLFTPH